jgi:hypothetical protein
MCSHGTSARLGALGGWAGEKLPAVKGSLSHFLPHLAFSEDWGYFSQTSNAACGGSMKGIDFVTNKSGKKTGVLIDLKRHGQLWEDFYDSVVARNRTREPRESLDAVKDRLRRLGKLSG